MVVRTLKHKFSEKLAKLVRDETANAIRTHRKLLTLSWNEIPRNVLACLPSEDYSSYEQSFEQGEYFPDYYLNIKKNKIGQLLKTKNYQLNLALLEKHLKIYVDDNIQNEWSIYEKRLKEELKKHPLTHNERKEYLNPETLQGLTVDDYLILTHRLTGDFASHVTRYGVRENMFSHATGGAHTVGEGTFVDSFTPLLKSGSIKSKIDLLKGDKYFVNVHAKNLIEYYKNDESVIFDDDRLLDLFLEHFTKSDSGAMDFQSAHFALNYVNKDYGTENGYSIYAYYPLEVLTDNFEHGLFRDVTNIPYNDFYVYANGGVPLDLGILVIPGNVDVDPKTGSQYQLDKSGKPKIEQTVDGLVQYVRAQETIKSEEFWENYFSQHPEQKPARVVYNLKGANVNGLIPVSLKSDNKDNLFNDSKGVCSHLDEKYKQDLNEIKSFVAPILYNLRNNLLILQQEPNNS